MSLLQAEISFPLLAKLRNAELCRMRCIRIASIFLFFQLLFLNGAWSQIPASDPVGPHLREKPLFSAGIIADAQYCDCKPMKGRFYRISEEKLQVAVDTFNARDVDFVINLGDVIDQSLESYPIVLKELERLQMPLYNVLGNHEFWNVPFHAQKTILDSLNLGHNYCSHVTNGWRLIMLDGTDLAEYAQGAHPETREEGEASRLAAKGRHNAALWNGAIGNQQMAWMEREMAEAAFHNQPVAVFCHFPINPKGHPLTLWNDDVLRKVISKYSTVEAWFAGHAHEGGYTWADGIHHVTLQGMLMTPDSNAFAVLNFFPDRIEMQGFGREPSRILMNKNVNPKPAITIQPEQKAAPIPRPPNAYPCESQRITNAFGEVIFIGESGGLSEPKTPQMKPGVFLIEREKSGKITFEKLVVLPQGAQ